MKRSLAFILAVLMTFALAACGKEEAVPTQAGGLGGLNDKVTPTTAGGGNTGVVSVPDADKDTPADKGTSDAGSFDADTVGSNIAVETETYQTSYSNYVYLILTNNSGSVCDVSADVDFYDKDNKIVGTKSDSENCFAPGTTIAMRFSCDEEFAKYEYTVSAEEPSDWYVAVDQDLKCDVSTATKKAIISVTNNGSVTAKYVEYHALFYKGDKVVGTDWGFVGDSNSEIKPGSTQKDEANIYDDDGFDTVKVYVHGTGKTES